MSVNWPYRDASALPTVVPVFPLTRALLLPRGELPLNIFEPRYIAMIDDAIASERIVGMIQPLPGQDEKDVAPPLFEIGCVGRITRFSETGDGRYLISLTGVARFRIEEELDTPRSYRRCRVNYDEFHIDLQPGAGEDDVDRSGMIRMLREFAESSKLEVDWTSIDAAPNEALVNALAMMSPFGADEKQALLEAVDLKSRAEILVALAELDLAQNSDDPPQFH
ncbi:MAG: peptidase S16 [Methylocystaceae bacterium]|nr:MAG: peptidase S16 [Methylocystaceae bacterium]